MLFSNKLFIALLTPTISSPCTGFSARTQIQPPRTPLHANSGVDTDPVLPSFATKDEYTSYLQKAGSLPQGFAVGTAKGTFVSVEAPALGPLPIKATVIHLTEGPSDSWGAVFTGNRVSIACFIFIWPVQTRDRMIFKCTFPYHLSQLILLINKTTTLISLQNINFHHQNSVPRMPR